ncbi:MAG: 1-deoxy-D-xylulose-5-phosphate reductoisomerase [Candidatus Cloacimonetes bacterium]|nr:1-deoxy-D-xylulose-5-phosphate reductoisomerase [Candidatus Cloacimonadota bacterium]
MIKTPLKKIAILGITGSIGNSAITVVRAHQDRFKIVLASADSNEKALTRIIHEFNIPNAVLTGDYNSITDGILAGKTALLDLIASVECDIILNAVSGSAGLEYSLATLRAGKDLALANKESLVMAGHIMMKEAAANNVSIIPVDSEHSALLQALGSFTGADVRKLILTASGGAFRDLPLSSFSKIDKSMALKHPTWSMGTKVTIDSATMMNKGLEIIEAHWLFGIPYDRIEAVLHPQSIVHSLVEFVDGSLIAQLSRPTMQLPILLAFSWPKRIASDLVRTSLSDMLELSFAPLDETRYPILPVVKQCAREGGLMPTIMNAANEAAIQLFLQDKIHFTDIAKVVEKITSNATNIAEPDLDTILQANKTVYEEVMKQEENIYS